MKGYLLAHVFTPKPSSLHYKIALLGGTFSTEKPKTFCGYVAAVLGPVTLGVILAVSFALACLCMVGGAMILLGVYTTSHGMPSVVSFLLGGVFGFFALATGSLFHGTTRIGRWCTAGMDSISSAIGCITRSIRSLCTTTVTYEAPPDR
jgi:hypothetical protein